MRTPAMQGGLADCRLAFDEIFLWLFADDWNWASAEVRVSFPHLMMEAPKESQQTHGFTAGALCSLTQGND